VVPFAVVIVAHVMFIVVVAMPVMVMVIISFMTVAAIFDNYKSRRWRWSDDGHRFGWHNATDGA
jgi:uncharacterized paraquat-inducible protein A